MARRVGRAVWLGGTRLAVAAVILGTGAVVRATVASGPSDGGSSSSSTVPAAESDQRADAVTTTLVDSPAPGSDGAGTDTTVLVAAPVPPSRTPTIETAAPSHVRSATSVWIEDRDDELHLTADVADVCASEVKVEENAAVIYLYVFENPAADSSCRATGGSLTVRLDGPLAGRAVVDAVTGEQFVVGLGAPGAAAVTE